MRLQAGAIETLQHNEKGFLMDFFEEAQCTAIHEKRVTVMVKEIHLAIRMHDLDKGILDGFKFNALNSTGHREVE